MPLAPAISHCVSHVRFRVHFVQVFNFRPSTSLGDPVRCDPHPQYYPQSQEGVARLAAPFITDPSPFDFIAGAQPICAQSHSILDISPLPPPFSSMPTQLLAYIRECPFSLLFPQSFVLRLSVPPDPFQQPTHHAARYHSGTGASAA